MPANTSNVIDIVAQNSTTQSKSSSCKLLKWWSSLSPFVQGLILGVLVDLIILTIVLPLWLVKPSNSIATTVTKVKEPFLRWNTTGITVAGIVGVAGSASNNLKAPWDVKLDLSNNLYVSDRFNNRIQKFAMNINNGTTIAGRMNATSGITMDALNLPTGIHVDINGNVYISDTDNNRIQFCPNGATTNRTLLGNSTIGSTDNLLYNPYGIWRDPSSSILYIADSFNHRIMRYRNNSQSGEVVAGGNGSGISSSQLSYPYDFYIDSLSNSFLIANAGGHNIVRWILGAHNWTIVAGSSNGLSGNNASLLQSPTDVTLDPMGNIYVADMQNHRIQFFSPGQSNGITIAGISGSSGSTSSQLNFPSSITLDSQLNLYVVDQYNHRIQKFVRY